MWQRCSFIIQFNIFCIALYVYKYTILSCIGILQVYFSRMSSNLNGFVHLHIISLKLQQIYFVCIDSISIQIQIEVRKNVYHEYSFLYLLHVYQFSLEPYTCSQIYICMKKRKSLSQALSIVQFILFSPIHGIETFLFYFRFLKTLLNNVSSVTSYPLNHIFINK